MRWLREFDWIFFAILLGTWWALLANPWSLGDSLIGAAGILLAAMHAYRQGLDHGCDIMRPLVGDAERRLRRAQLDLEDERRANGC